MDNFFQNILLTCAAPAASMTLREVYAVLVFILARVHQERGGRGMGYKHSKTTHDKLVRVVNTMKAIVLKSDPTKDDAEWRFTVPARALALPPNAKVPYIKAIQFTAKAITLQFERMPMNRVLNADDSSLFILASFATLRFPDAHLGDTADYILRLMTKGLFLNDVQYRFYHHSNSQLVSHFFTALLSPYRSPGSSAVAVVS